MTPADLISFELEVAAAFNAGRIRAPVHLVGGCEEQLIEIFQDVRKNDWVATQWRSHYHCLLRGVPRQQLMDDILAGHSITLCYPEHRIISSAIVGGVLPIALGLAWSEKQKGGGNKVWAFVGDMTARTGMFHECRQYAIGHDLPIEFVIENNGMSVCTDTAEAWGTGDLDFVHDKTTEYFYKLPFPHAGAGVRVQF